MDSKRFSILLRTTAVILSGLAVPFAQGQDLLIGQVSSQTSPITAANAKGLFAGINVYFADVNAKGGINGRMVKLINKDDELKPGRMTELTKEFIADKNVLALAAYQNTSGITELSKLNVVGAGGIAMIAPLQGDKSIVGAANFFPFRSGYPDEVTALAKESVFMQHKKVVVLYQNVTLGPPMMKYIQDVAAEKVGLNVAAYVKIDATVAPDKLEGVIRAATAEVVKVAPDAVILLGGGRPAIEFLKQFKDSPAAGAQIYLMSIVPQSDVIKAIGEVKARGIVLSQAVPFPFSPTLALVNEYQKLMKKYAPDEAYSFSTLEGFISGKITVEALKRAGPKPTREKVLMALNTMGEFDLGGVYVNYTSKARNGWEGVDLTMIGANGKLMH